MSSHALLAAAASETLDRVLINELGLQPPVSYAWAERSGRAILFARLDPEALGRSIGAYDRPDTLRHLSQALSARLGHPARVIMLERAGLYYAANLSPSKPLPTDVPFPGIQPGLLRLGVSRRGEAVLPWQVINRMGHIMVAGATGSGKSVCLRSIVHQAIGAGFIVRLSDMDSRTFPMLTGHARLDMPIANTDKAIFEMVQFTLGECEHRARVYSQVDGYPDNLDEYNALARRFGKQELPRILLVLDEYTSTVTHLGGPKGEFAAKVEELGWRGRKFGVVIVFATQELTKDLIGSIRSQASLRLCFRIEDSQVLSALELKGAENIKAAYPGRAMTNRWGFVQTYLLEKEQLGKPDLRPLTEREQRIFDAAQTAGGRVTRGLLMTILGVGENEARTIQAELAALGWIKKRADGDNAFHVTPKWYDLATNRQPPQPPPTQNVTSNHLQPALMPDMDGA